MKQTWQPKQNIVLIGFMGCGKSTVGNRLSWKYKIALEDTDKMIERQQNTTIKEIFATQGEEAFRQMETDLLEALPQKKYIRIISVGGGTPVRACNRSLLKKCGVVIYLRIQPESVYERLKGDQNRPLLQCEDPLSRIRELLAQREDAYESCADAIIDVDHLTLDQVTDRIGKIMKGKQV